MTSYIASMLHYILCRLPMWVPVRLAHQEETFVRYPIANHRLEFLLRRVRVEDVTIVAFADHQLDPQKGDEVCLLGSGTDVSFSHVVPAVVCDTLDPLCIRRIQQLLHHSGQMLFQWPFHFDHILIGTILIGYQKVVVVLNPFKGMGHDDGSTLL